MQLRSVVVRLSLGLFVVVAGALLIVYLVVVPTLENRLIDAKVSQLERRAPQVALDLERNSNSPFFNDVLASEAQELNGRVAIFEIFGSDAPKATTVIVRRDSGSRPRDLVSDPIALRAWLHGGSAHGIVERGGVRYAEAVSPLAVPPYTQYYGVLLSASLTDSLENVKLVERQIIIAGLIALAIALVVGYGAARMFSGRIRRLERAAERIASGHFDEPVVDRHRDELGQLAVAFDRMRQRLSHLERARREFIANASHELRTPLFSLAGLLELLTDEDLDEDTRREFLLTMREQVERLTKLATDLLDLSRLDAGRLHVEREAVELAPLVRTLADEFAAVAQSGDHPVETGGEEVIAVADEQRVLQIGRILVENALVHTAPGTPVRVAARAGGGRALLTVEDEGPGIPDEHRAHVFERFYRVDGAVSSGSGLGLAIARELAELMGGELQLESRPGRTVFTLALPLVRAPEPAAVA